MIAKHFLHALPGLLLLFPCGLFAQDQPTNKSKDRPIHALLVTGGCCHDYDRQKLILTRGISARANVRWTVVHQGGTTTNTPIPLYNDPNWADGFDIVVHNECFSDVKDLEFVDRILQPHKDGTPAILIHCAMHCYRTGDNRWFDFVGMQSPGHGPHYSYAADNVKPDHPIMTGFGKSFVAPKGELYHSMKVFKTATPLAQANRQTDGKPQVCVWTNDYQGTRVFGTTIGHYNETMAEPKYLDMVTKGLLWAVKRDTEEDFTPATEKTDDEIKALISAPVQKTASKYLPGNCCGDANLAYKKPVTSKSVQENNDRSHLTDGLLNTRFCANGSQVNEWVTVDLEKPEHVKAIRLHWEKRTGISYRYTIEVSADDKDWMKVVDDSKNDKPGGLRTHKLDAPNTRYIKTTFLGADQGLWGSLWELEASAGELPDLGELVSETPDAAPASVVDVQAPPDFNVTMFGSPPDVNYPVCLTAAATGEVFVGVDEMGSLGKEKGRGKVLRCIDIDGDGTADEITEFAKMDHPRGLVYDNGSLWVLHPPYFSVFHDTDGNGRSDTSELLIDGISTVEVDKRGADHTTNGIRMGIDGWIYIAVGDYGFNKAYAPKDGTTLSKRGGGIVRIRPNGREMEVFAWGLRNIMDVAIDPYMNVFTRDNTNDGGGWDIRFSHILQSAHYGYPSLYKNFTEEIMPPLVDLGGGSGCGSMFFQDERWPKGFNNMVLTCDWGRSEVYSHIPPANGATFDAQESTFLKIPRPTDIDADASGRMYVASWKNGKFAYDGPNIGFVARVTPAGFVPKPVPSLTGKTSAELVELLKHPGSAFRQHVQLALVRRSIDEYLTTSVKNLENFPAIRLTPEAARAAADLLSTNSGSETATTDISKRDVVDNSNSPLRVLASDPSAPLYARVAAIFTDKEINGAASNVFLTSLMKDSSVREYCIRAMTDRTSQLAFVDAQTLIPALQDPSPRVQAAAVVGLGRMFQVRVTTSQSDGLSDLVSPFKMPKQDLAAARPLVAEAVLPLTNYEPSASEGDAWRQPDARRVIPHLAVKTLVTINAIDECIAALNGPHRNGALWALKSMHDVRAVDGLFRVLSTTVDPSLRRDVWTTLIRLYHREGDFMDDSPKWWGTRPDTTGPYYDRKKWDQSDRIADAIKIALTESDQSTATHIKEQLKRHVVKLGDIDEIEIAAMNEPEKAITVAAADPNNPDQIANLSYTDVLSRALKAGGKPDTGKRLFHTQSCINCHTFANGQRPKGPHLVDIGKRYKPHELVESIVEPSKKLAQGFDTWTFVMASGKTHTGFVVQESAESVIIRQTDGLSRELLQDDIDDRVKQDISMMPKGVVGNLTPEQVADLIAYLQTLH